MQSKPHISKSELANGGFQNFTDLDKVTRKQYAKLPPEKRKVFTTLFAERIKAEESGQARSLAVLKLASIIGGREGTDLKLQVWEVNHDAIITFISNQLIAKSKMPTITEIASGTGLSRPTIVSHINSFKKSAFAKNQMERFRLLKTKLMGTLYRLGTELGDVRAIKVLLDTIDNAERVSIGTQNNFIQVNGTTLKQDQLSGIDPARLKKIERFLRKEIIG